MAKKLVSILLALSMMLTVLAACNNEPVVDETPDDGQQQEDIQGNDKVEEPFDGILKLVVDGVSDYVIVRGENAYISEVTASTELQKYLKQISGVEIPIVTDATEPVAKEIVVGKTNREIDGEFDRDELGDDGLVIKTNGQKLFLVGGEQRGTLYAVYEFLESYLGCGFYTVDVEKVPEMKTISLNKIEEDKQIPVMDFRSVYWSDYSNQNIAVKRKINAWTGGAHISEEMGGSFIWTQWVHTFGGLVNYGTYGAEHPEYFAHYEDGTVIMNGSNPQLCLTNPDVLQMSIDVVRSWLNAVPDAKVVSVSQNDGGGPCMCTECQKVYAEENGAYSGAVIRFVNAIATELKDEFPDVKFDTLAYQYTRNVCVTKPAENVIVRLCTIECCFTHPLSECDVQTYKPGDSAVSENSLAVDIQNWANICDTLFIWDYVTNFNEYSVNFSAFRTLKENMKFFADNKVSGMFEQGNGQNTSSEFGELRAYLTSQLLWDPYMSDDEYYSLMDEFLLNVYGPGWSYIREYIDYRAEYDSNYHAGCKENDDNILDIYKMEKVFYKDTTEIPESLTLEKIENYETTDWTPYLNYYSNVSKPEIIDKGYELFGKAYELAENDLQKAKIDKAMIQVEILDSYYRLEAKKQYMSNIILSVQNTLSALDLNTTEINDWKNTVRVFVMDKCDSEYFEYNKALSEKMISYGIRCVSEVWNSEDWFADREPKLSKAPSDW